jgi:hypothetical protein
MVFISQNGLKALKEYKYASSPPTLLDTYMNVWWEFVVNILPKVISLSLKK